VEQVGGGTGERVLKSGSRRPAIPGPRLERRPRARFAPSHSGGVGAPPGGTMASCQELADVAGLWSRRMDADALQPKQQPAQGPTETPRPTKARPDAVRKTPQQSAERRAGPRQWPVISGRIFRRWTYPRGRSRVRRIRTSACRRSAPLVFSGSGERTRGTRPHPTGPAELGCLTIESGICAKRTAYSVRSPAATLALPHSLPCVFPGCPHRRAVQYKDHTREVAPWTPRTPPPP
jgi:hypothetical protein